MSLFILIIYEGNRFGDPPPPPLPTFIWLSLSLFLSPSLYLYMLCNFARSNSQTTHSHDQWQTSRALARNHEQQSTDGGLRTHANVANMLEHLLFEKGEDVAVTLKLAHLVTSRRFLSDASASHTNAIPAAAWDTLPPITVLGKFFVENMVWKYYCLKRMFVFEIEFV